MAIFFQDNLGKPAPEILLDFTEARHVGVAVAPAGPYANRLHLAPDRQPCQHLYRLDALHAAKPLKAFIMYTHIHIEI